MTESTNFIELMTNVSSRPLRFFIDTGSDISLIKKEEIDEGYVDYTRKIKIKGVTDGEINSIGTCKICFKVDYVRFSKIKVF